MYNQTYYYDGYLIGPSAKISFVDSLPTGLSSGYALDILLLSFITQASYLENYSTVTPAHGVVW